MTTSAIGLGGAALLAACGGGDESEPDGSSATLLTPAKDTTQQAKRGGMMKDRTIADVPGFESLGASRPLGIIASHVMSGLWQLKPGYMKPVDNELIGDLAESWETSPDGLSLTFKLRQGVKWHNKPPVNNRLLDIEDVLFSWQRFATKNGSRGNVVNSLNPSAPVISVTAVNSQTAVIKLSEPIVYAMAIFTGLGGGIPGVVYPREIESGYDPRSDMIGSGPFMLTDYRPSTSFTFKRNPDYWEKDDALVDQIEMPIIPEYAAALAQFKAGNIYSMGNYYSIPSVSAEDLLPIKKEEPRILIYQSRYGGSQLRRAFGWLPDGKSPFLDERVRQAASLSWDRDLFTDTFFDAAKLESQGLPVESRWSTALPGLFEGWWLDPKSAEFGPNRKYFQHDPSEAKKLLAAAGYSDGFDVASHYVLTPELGDPRQMEVLDAMSAEIGMRSKVRGVDYQKEYIPQYRDGKGQWEGWAYKTSTGAPGKDQDAIVYLTGEYWSKAGPSFAGFSLTGENDMSGDPQVDSLIEKGRLERDTAQRKEIVLELQRHLAKAVYTLPFPALATGYFAAWPCIGNVRVFDTERPNYRLWIDDTKAPLA